MALDQGEPTRGLAYIMRALRLDPSCVLAYRTRAEKARNEQRFAQALPDIERVIALDPAYFWGYLARGELRARTGDTPGAVEDYTHAIELEPEAPDFRYFRAALYLKTGELEKAYADAQKIVDDDPNSYRGPLMMAMVRLEQKRYDGADGAFRHSQVAVSLNQEGAICRIKLAEALDGVGRRGEAIEQVRFVLTMPTATPADLAEARGFLAELERR